MNRHAPDLFELLGETGLRRVLEDVLDRSRLERLAVACGLKYPGMRLRSQAREKLVADLVRHARDRADARRSIARLLEKETRPAYRSWCGLDPEERARRLADRGQAAANLGLHLYFAAREAGNGGDPEAVVRARDELLRLAEDPANGQSQADRPSREATRLRKSVAELERKVSHLEHQLSRSRDAEKTTKRDLLQRKGELAESRMLVERLRAEIAELKSAAPAGTPPRPEPPAEDALPKLNRAVRKLAAEQRALLRSLEARDAAPAERPPAPPDLTPFLESLEALRKEIGGLRREARKERKEVVERVAGLGSELHAAAEALRRPRRPGPQRTEDERVGVFVDVQNVYYGARRLKGKLDFDALLERAAAGRRLIRAVAYVVESKEIDQSGFIAMLQQRAIEVRRKTLQIRADGSMKGNWDMELALEVLDAAPDLDVVVLVSGDGDFTSLVTRVKQIGPRVELMGFPRHTAKSLLGAADVFHPLDRRFMIASEPEVDDGARRTAPRAARKPEVEARANGPQAEDATKRSVPSGSTSR